MDHSFLWLTHGMVQVSRCGHGVWFVLGLPSRRYSKRVLIWCEELVLVARKGPSLLVSSFPGAHDGAPTDINYMIFCSRKNVLTRNCACLAGSSCAQSVPGFYADIRFLSGSVKEPALRIRSNSPLRCPHVPYYGSYPILKLTSLRLPTLHRQRANREVQTVNWEGGGEGAVERGVKRGLKKAHKPWIRSKKGAQTVN